MKVDLARNASIWRLTRDAKKTVMPSRDTTKKQGQLKEHGFLIY